MCDTTNAIGRPLLTCKVCHQTENIRRCSGCQAAFYCSPTCQRQDWKYHRAECRKNPPSVSSITSPVSASSSRMMTEPLPSNSNAFPFQEHVSALGAGTNSNNNNFTSDSDFLVENMIQQQQHASNFENDLKQVVNETSNNDELRDFSIIDELFFGSPTGEIDLTTDIQLTTNPNVDQNHFGIGQETMRLDNTNIYNPELNMQFR